MNYQKVHRKNRKAISPVLATVILIAITLIAAIAIAGFVFGLFGSFTSSAQVSAQVTSCTSAAGLNGEVCTVVLTNSGTSNVAVTGCSIRVSGVSETGATGGTLTVTAGGAGSTTTCTAGVLADIKQTSGSSVNGQFSLANGASVPFTGTWT